MKSQSLMSKIPTVRIAKATWRTVRGLNAGSQALIFLGSGAVALYGGSVLAAATLFFLADVAWTKAHSLAQDVQAETLPEQERLAEAMARRAGKGPVRLHTAKMEE